jgi:hypothetical protein
MVALPSCNVFDARSGELSCSEPSDCSPDRSCESGYCVVRNGLDPDAATGIPDADPGAPDADPNAPDADPGAPDATPPADASPCSLLPLMDAFDDGFAAPQWIEVDTASVTIEEAGGVLTFSNTVLPANPTTVSYLSVTRNYDMTSSAFAIEVPTMVNTASKAEVSLRIGSAGNSNIEFSQDSGLLKITLSDGGQNVLANIAYNATAHRWWRAAEFAGTLYAQTSPDGSTWTTRGSAATPSFISALGVDLEMRAANTGVVPGSLVFDNANIGVDCLP